MLETYFPKYFLVYPRGRSQEKILLFILSQTKRQTIGNLQVTLSSRLVKDFFKTKNYRKYFRKFSKTKTNGRQKNHQMCFSFVIFLKLLQILQSLRDKFCFLVWFLFHKQHFKNRSVLKLFIVSSPRYDRLHS